MIFQCAWLLVLTKSTMTLQVGIERLKVVRDDVGLMARGAGEVSAERAWSEVT